MYHLLGPTNTLVWFLFLMHLKRDLLPLLTVSQTLFLTDNCIYLLILTGLMIVLIFFVWVALQPFEVLTLKWGKFSLHTLQNSASFHTQSFLSRCNLWYVHLIWGCRKPPYSLKKIQKNAQVLWKTYEHNLTSGLLQDCIMLKVWQHQFHL